MRIPADGSADLSDLAHRRQPIQPRQEGGVERARNRPRRQRAIEHVAIAGSRTMLPSITAFVSSSAKSGTPSVRATT